MEIRLRWFELIVRRPVDFVVRRVDQMEGSQTARSRDRPRKTIKKGLEINELDRDVLYDRK